MYKIYRMWFTNTTVHIDLFNETECINFELVYSDGQNGIRKYRAINDRLKIVQKQQCDITIEYIISEYERMKRYLNSKVNRGENDEL